MAGRNAERDRRGADERGGIHPPDYIEILPDHPRSETLRGSLSSLGPAPLNLAEQELDARMAPLGPRPSRDHGITVIELVGPETDPSTIVGGNESLSGALLQSSYYDIRLWVKVRRTGIGGRPGRFRQHKVRDPRRRADDLPGGSASPGWSPRRAAAVRRRHTPRPDSV